MTDRQTSDRQRVWGIDFSGAIDAGKKIWVAGGVVVGGNLRIKQLRRGDSLPGSGGDCLRCIHALRNLVSSERNAVFGFDFPFGLPGAIVGAATWDDFVRTFAERYPDALTFRRTCFSQARGRELRRKTDRNASTPFAAYNLRIYRQTYVGVRDLLARLVAEGIASVLPMQPPDGDRAWVIEICPASTLKALGLYRALGQPYKGRSADARQTREWILGRLEADASLQIEDPVTREVAIVDHGGDALDSLIAALATAWALPSLRCGLIADDVARIEGHVYV